MANANNNLPERILVVDNDEGVLNAIAKGLEPYKIQVLTAKDWQSAFYKFNHNRLDLVVVSIELEEMTGTALVQKWRAHEHEAKKNIAVVLVSSMNRKANDDSLIKELGDMVLLTKPVKIPALLSAMANALLAAKERLRLHEINYKIINPLLAQHKYEKAAHVAKEQLEVLGEKGMFQSAKIHIDAKLEQEAIDLLNKLIEKDPQNMGYHNELGRAYLSKGNLDAAKASYETADKVAPNNIDRLSDMADLYLRMNLPDESVDKFKQLINLTPEDKDVKFGMYEKVYQAGFVEKAQEFCRQTSTPKELVKHFNNKGVVLSKQEQHSDAIDEYGKAMRYIPGSKELYRVLYNMALAHINMKSYEHLQKAHELLLESLKLEPDFDKAKEKLAITSKYFKDHPNPPGPKKKAS